LLEFFVKAFRRHFFVKYFCYVFELPSLRNTRNRDKTKEVEKNKRVSADCIAAVSKRVSLGVVRLENPGFAPTHPPAPTNKTPRIHPATDPGTKISAFEDVG
jgi:hypothetical protein